MVVKHQHHIGNALHQHRGLGRSPLSRRFGDDFSGRQRGNERFFPQDLAGSGNALPYPTGKKRAYLFQIQHFGQLRVQQVQVQLALHFGFQLWRLRAKGDALQKRMDGRAAFRPGHAGLLQKGRAAQGQFLFGMGHGADTDFNRDGFQRFVGALPCKRFQQAFGQGIVRQGRGFRLRCLHRGGRVQQADVQRRFRWDMMGQQFAVFPQFLAGRVQHSCRQQPERPVLCPQHGFGIRCLGAGKHGRIFQFTFRSFQRYRNDQRILRTGQRHI